MKDLWQLSLFVLFVSLTSTVLVIWHEIWHAIIYVIEGSGWGSCGILGGPVAVELSQYGPTWYACSSGESVFGTRAINYLFTDLMTIIAAILLIDYSKWIWNKTLRLGVLVGATWVWLWSSFYMSGLFNRPTIVDGRVIPDLGHGELVLEHFGIVGMFPGLLALAVGGVVLWDRLQYSEDMDSGYIRLE